MRSLLAAAALALFAGTAAAQSDTLTVGILKFGTVRWELDVIDHHDLDRAEGFTLEVKGYGGGEASNVALMAGEVDCIVDDWLWVGRMRADGADLTFAFPYSSTVGGLVVHAGSGIDSLEKLKGLKIGVAGGPYDKSWLLIRAVVRKEHGFDPAETNELAFGAPPLLNEKFIGGELDAVLNYWHYVARLEAAGHPVLYEAAAAQEYFGVPRDVPQLGWVCRGEVLREKGETVKAFSRASRRAKQILKTDDSEWERIRELTRAENDAVFEALKRRWRAGVPERWGDAEREAAAKLFALLAELGGEQLVGKAKKLPAGTFWDAIRW